ncbi:hypothetical protein HII31_11048 [Pseudocercospora fuligena]|uniref:AA1-like domain-containing protein n=1 Tax=Pseudocercospora fuligena TaxID=685502 RepID=A0A8H6VGY8_9PEZI|nr:hypothetical protein HII31_11048 [Pseudocercospora fuligena]
MFSSNILTALATLATTTNALYFHLSPFVATDIRIPSESHALSFTISNPDAVFEQGGSAPRNCSITWSGENSSPPTCFTECSDAGYPYFARICPGSYNYAGDFSLEILEYYIYKNSALNNATLTLKEGEDGYACSRGGQSTVCTFQNDGYGVDTGLETRYSVMYPENVC